MTDTTCTLPALTEWHDFNGDHAVNPDEIFSDFEGPLASDPKSCVEAFAHSSDTVSVEGVLFNKETIKLFEGYAKDKGYSKLEVSTHISMGTFFYTVRGHQKSNDDFQSGSFSIDSEDSIAPMLLRCLNNGRKDLISNSTQPPIQITGSRLWAPQREGLRATADLLGVHGKLFRVSIAEDAMLISTTIFYSDGSVPSLLTTFMGTGQTKEFAFLDAVETFKSSQQN